MAKLVKIGFTDYFGGIQKIDIVEYDNNKYVTIILPDGRTESIKRGYIRADDKLTRSISSVNWFIHGGGKRKNFKAYTRKTNYSMYLTNGSCVEFNSKKAVLKKAIGLAKYHAKTIEVCAVIDCNGGTRGSSWGGGVEILCHDNGHAAQYGPSRSKRRNQTKYLRGYGKVMRPR